MEKAHFYIDGFENGKVTNKVRVYATVPSPDGTQTICNQHVALTHMRRNLPSLLGSQPTIISILALIENLKVVTYASVTNRNNSMQYILAVFEYKGYHGFSIIEHEHSTSLMEVVTDLLEDFTLYSNKKIMLSHALRQPLVRLHIGVSMLSDLLCESENELRRLERTEYNNPITITHVSDMVNNDTETRQHRLSTEPDRQGLSIS